MKKISAYENEDALDLLADIIEPAAEIFADKDVAAHMRDGKKMTAIKTAIKSHKKAVIEILARFEGVPVEDYKCNILSLPTTLLEILNDEALLGFFTASVRKNTETSGGNATENTEESGR